jgi:hypothetical protein
MTIEYAGETFEGYNKPKATPKNKIKSHAVLAKIGDQIKLIRFGEPGATRYPPEANESEADKAKRKAFYERHKTNIAKGRFSAAWWAWNHLWQ